MLQGQIKTFSLLSSIQQKFLVKHLRCIKIAESLYARILTRIARCISDWGHNSLIQIKSALFIKMLLCGQTKQMNFFLYWWSCIPQLFNLCLACSFLAWSGNPWGQIKMLHTKIEISSTTFADKILGFHPFHSSRKPHVIQCC